MGAVRGTIDPLDGPLSMAVFKAIADKLVVELTGCELVDSDSFIASLEECMQTEFADSSTKYVNVPPAICLGIKWIAIHVYNTVFQKRVVGKADLKIKIINQLLVKEEEFTTPNSVDDSFVGELCGNQRGNMPDMDTQFDGTEQAKASQLALAMTNAKFNGSIGANYVSWKFEVLEMLSRKHLQNSLIGYYVVYNSLTDFATTIAQAAEFFPKDPAKSLMLLVATLDKYFLTQRAIAKFEDEYVQLKQETGELVSSYSMRFRRMCDTYCRLHKVQLNDVQRKIKFGGGLLNQWKSIKSLVDGICAQQSFDEYVDTLVQYTVGMEGQSGNPFGGQMQKPHFGHIGTGSKCYRCDQVGHKSDVCTKQMSPHTRCNICGMRNHSTDKCVKKGASVKCNRCGKSGHSSGCCRAPQPIKQACMKADDEITDDLQLEHKVITCCATGTANRNCGGIPMEELIAPSPEEVFRIGDATYVEIKALADSGANASFVHPRLADYLKNNGLVKDQRSVHLPVTYGNEAQGAAHTAILLSGSVQDLEIEGWFLVSDRCSPRLIFGQPILNKLKTLRSKIQMSRMAVTIPDVEVRLDRWVEAVEHGNSQALEIRFPLLETAIVLPYKEAPRKRSITDSRIMKARLDRMAELKQCVKVSPNEAFITLSPVLVDKLAPVGDVDGGTKPPPRQYFESGDPNHESIHTRYRMTVDCRPINEMSFVPIKSGLFALQPIPCSEVLHHSASNQHQSSSVARLKKLQYGRQWFAKLDMKDAFAALRLPSAMSKLFCVSFVLDGVDHCYQYLTMPQGWKYSSFFFDIAMDHVMRRIEKTLMEEFKVTMIYYQDDSILNGPDEHLTNQALDFLIDHLRQFYSFVVRPEKCTRAQATMDFCGMRISAKGVIAIPLRKKFTHELIHNGWQSFISCKDKAAWTRSWVGRFNYFRSFLSFDLHIMKCLETLQTLLRRNGKMPTDDNDTKAAFFDISDFCLHRLPNIAYGYNKFHETLGTILIADANHDAWSGILFRIIKSDLADDAQYPFSEVCSDIQDFHGLLVKCGISEPFHLMPIGLHGNVFNAQQQRQSSTHRERHAILMLVDHFYAQLDGTLFIICDNQNCRKKWDIDLLTGCELQLWSRLQSIDHQFIWTPRDGIPKYADWLARQQICPDQCFTLEIDDEVEHDRVDVHLDSNQASTNGTPEDVPHSLITPQFRRQLIHGYRTDEKTTFHRVSLRDIYKWKSKNNVDYAGLSAADKRIHTASKHFTVEDQILKYNSIDGLKIVIPDVECDIPILDDVRAVHVKAAILYMYHNKLLHPGKHRLYSSISRRFYWPKLESDIRRYISSCLECNLRKNNSVGHGTSELGKVTTLSKKIFEMVMLDYASFENHNVLFIIDCYSHFLFTHEVESADAKSTAIALFKIITQIGCPHEILHDNGSHFVNKTMDDLALIMGYRINLSTPYLPRRNGLVESSVKGVKNSLRFWNEADYDFGVALDVATYMHNTNQLAHFPLSPYEIVFGQQATPITNTFDLPSADLQRDIIGIRNAWDVARMRQADHLRDRHNQSQLNNIPFKVDDTVIVRQGNNIGIDTLKEKHSSNHWILASGAIVSEAHLQLCPRLADDITIPAILPIVDSGIKVGDIILFKTTENDDQFIDVGSVLSVSDEMTCTLQRFYCNENLQWFSHGQEHQVTIPIANVLQVVKLTKDHRIPKRVLTRLGILDGGDSIE